MDKPRDLSLVHFSDECYPETVRGQYPLHEDRLYLFLGEIPNMPEHCVVMDQASGELFVGYHIELFTEMGGMYD